MKFTNLISYRYKSISMLLGLFGLTSVINSALAQSDTLKNDAFGTYIIMPIEFPVTDRTALNEKLNASGLPDAIHPAANAGIGIQAYANRFFFTVAFNKGTREREEDTYLTEVEYRSTSFNVGYSLTKSHMFSVYPYAGLKMSGLNYLYREKVPAEIPFEDYLEQDLKYLELNQSRAHLDLGLGISAQWFYLVNARAGYLVPFEKYKWTINNADTDLTGSPGMKYKSYFSLTFGLGSLFTNDMERNHNRR
ncbi:hypothetical protein WG947_03680 [Pontibacter sp. H259]|uniref:hypothetical protein n=1 Tax=Pontibacter sp. H259 TaxID=3133421 RepID=UPI0030C17EBE